MSQPSQLTLRAGRVYDGVSDQPRPDCVVEIAGGRIVALRPAGAADGPADCAVLAPGFIDLQVNGAADTLFNDRPEPAAIARIAAGMRQGGTAHLLPTFITAPGRDYLRAVTAAADAIRDGVPGVLGVHLEGPFISPRRPGIHDRAAIRPADAQDLAALSRAFPGALLVTLAPECHPPALTGALAAAGAILFAGHSEATIADIDAHHPALRGATHLWNAMSQLTGRAPGLVGAVLDSDSLFAGIIADGHHVAPANLRLAARVMGDRLCLVSDAMPSFAGTRPEFTLHGTRIHLSDGRLTDAAGTLAGAHIGQDECVANMIGLGAASPAAALRMASTNPARALELEGELGRIAPGYRASVTMLTEGWRSCGVVVDGARLA